VLAVEGGASGPFCSRLLGDLGADVVKVERPGTGDVNRHWDTVVHGESAAHAWLDRNKRSLELDLKREEGSELFLDLAERADVVTQNAAPGVVGRLGIGYEAVREVNSEIVYLHISGYGRSGPYSDRKAYDMITQGETGPMAMSGVPGAMAKIPLSICDINAAMYGALGGVDGAVPPRTDRRGPGARRDDVRGCAVVARLLPVQVLVRRRDPGTGRDEPPPVHPLRPLRGRRRRAGVLAVLSAAHWETFCRDVLERPGQAEDPRFAENESRVEHRETLETRIAEAFAERPREEWTARLQAAGIPWGDVNELDDVLAHPQADHLDAIREIPYRDGSLSFVDHPVDFGAVDTRREPMPDLGEHTESVLREVGLGDEAIRRLHGAGVVSAAASE
jgi:crotonobetainyl-CoA:carnitine CoA-transferase CaiB-like acyl-CoA transferase